MSQIVHTEQADTIEAKILQSLQSIYSCQGQALVHAREAGKLLRVAKDDPARGVSWEQWCESRVKLSVQAADWYIRIAENWKAVDKLRHGERSIAGAKRLLKDKTEGKRGGKRAGSGRKPAAGKKGNTVPVRGADVLAAASHRGIVTERENLEALVNDILKLAGVSTRIKLEKAAEPAV